VFLFLDPILDEKKRCQQFLARTARRLCGSGCHVVRFDYYGTGDSAGELYEFSFGEVLTNAGRLYRYIRDQYPGAEIILLGVRVGADLAVCFARETPAIKRLFLIEPVADGARFLLEQRMRRKLFYQLNRMNAEEYVEINQERFEDHQGFPLSAAVVSFLTGWHTGKAGLTGRTVHLFKLSAAASRKQMEGLRESLAAGNTVLYQEIAGPDFWSSLEAVDTTAVTEGIDRVSRQYANVNIS
jgi:pimeloyl-ACP methyl ester carboxylesterase